MSVPEIKIEDVKSVVSEGLNSTNTTIEAIKRELEDVKELAANLEAKADKTNLEQKELNVEFDVKAANLTLKSAITAAIENGRPLDIKTLNTGADGVDGLIAEELGRTVIERARENVAILGLIGNKSVGSVDYREMVLTTFPATAQGSEQTATPATEWAATVTHKYVSVAMKVGKQYAKPQISREAINDPHIDVFTHLQTLLAEEISRYWAVQVLYGDGSDNNIRGIFGDVRFNATERVKPTFGAAGVARSVECFPAFKSGIADSIGDTDPRAANSAIDNVVDLTAFLPSKYLAGAKFVMNRFTFAEYRKLKDLEGRPLIQFEAGGFQMAGYTVVLEDYMQGEDGTLKAPVIFGDLSKAYALCSIDDFFLVDPYMADGAITLKYESRKGDIVQQNDAIVILNTIA